MNSSNSITLTPFLTVRHAASAIEFYKIAFSAQEVERHELPNEKVMAKMSIGAAVFWLGDEEPEFDNLSPAAIGGSAVRIILTVADVDALFMQALEAGATQICPVTTEESWKIGKLKDPFGHIWEIGHPLDSENEGKKTPTPGRELGLC